MKLAAAALTFAATLALPAAAIAGCGPYQLGSTAVSCEQGVQVFRTSQPHLPRISPTNSAKLDLQRDALAQRRREAQLRDARARDRLELERLRLRQTDYLYRDAYSPLRGPAFSTGFNNGFVGGFNNGFAPGFRPAFAPGFNPAFRGQRFANGVPVRGQVAPAGGVPPTVAAPARPRTAGRPSAPRPMRAAPTKKHY